MPDDVLDVNKMNINPAWREAAIDEKWMVERQATIKNDL